MSIFLFTNLLSLVIDKKEFKEKNLKILKSYTIKKYFFIN